MAKRADLPKAPKKIKRVRTPIQVDEKYTGEEPQWDTEAAAKLEDGEFNTRLRRSFFYYNYYYSSRDLKKHVVDWLRRRGKHTPAQIKQFERGPDRLLPITACSLVMANRAGMPFRGNHEKYILRNIDAVINAAGDEEPVASPSEVAARPTIQDRLREKTNETIGELEGWYDRVVTLREKVDFKPYDLLVEHKVPQAQLGAFVEVFQERRDELELARSGEDEQLAEGYAHFKTADYKRSFDFIDRLIEAVDQYRQVKKATKKARVRKAPSKEKVVARLKHAKEAKELKLVSINPAEIIGSSELWVYNIKTRKLGKYIADDHATLGVKGTSITNFNESKSVAKTLRKPEEQLKEFARAGKVVLRTFLKDIRAVEVKMNGRINKDTLLLRVA